ncbi:MAG TPA: hypothetical protein VI873_01740 [Candidatus Peribacteraceae bacterium]|nr:MAG: hypothetical protein A2635_04880 [Candidatus Peribacteria bacterium RIFCSPHIGHO2_01_FULL_51_9]HLD71319.1 hypothetical protein [Candidatus Peribacteraceae bacterium]
MQKSLSHPLSEQAITWVSSVKGDAPHNAEQHSETRDMLRARIDSLTIRLLRQGIAEDRVRLLDAVLSEIGSNSFDHNIGQWRDISGVLFEITETDEGILCVLADRGQGIRATLSRVRPGIMSDTEALRIAFTERLSGRAPEQRGNGLKFVRSVLLQDGIDLWYGSGTAVYAMETRQENWMDIRPPILGCCAILLLKHS